MHPTKIKRSRASDVGRLAAGLFATLASCVWARPAAACGACECAHEARPILNLIRDVPLNLELPLRVLSADEAPPRVERVADGTLAPATVEKDANGANVWWLKVEQDLEPNREYRIMRDTGVDAQFTTGATRDVQAPTLEAASTLPGGNAALCDSEAGGQLTLTGATDDNQQFAVWVELEIDVGKQTQHRYLDYRFGNIGLGHSAMGCFGPSELSGIAAGQSYPGRVRLHDAGGNIGDWQSFVLPIAAEEMGGCGTPGGVAGGAGSSGQPTDPTEAGSGSEPPHGAGAPSSGSDGELTSRGCGCALAAGSGADGGAWALGFATLLLLGRRQQLRRPVSKK